MTNRLATVLMLSLALALASCSSSTTNNPTTNPVDTTHKVDTTHVHYPPPDTTHPAYTSTEWSLDSLDRIDLTTVDSVTIFVVNNSATFEGRSGVTALQNKHSNTKNPTDTMRIAQTTGNFWHHNFGLEWVAALAGSGIDAGWMLEAKFGAKAGDTWVACDTAVPYSFVTVNIKMVAVEQNDTTIMVNNSAITVKHIVHTATATLPAGPPVVATIDVYVSANYGEVLYKLHSFKIDPNFLVTQAAGKQIAGREILLTSHP